MVRGNNIWIPFSYEKLPRFYFTCGCIVRHINAWVWDEESKHRWLLNSFYGQPEVGKRKESWDLLASLKLEGSTGWCIVGDFNEIVTNDEKVEGRPGPRKQMERFREVLT